MIRLKPDQKLGGRGHVLPLFPHEGGGTFYRIKKKRRKQKVDERKKIRQEI